MKGEKVENENKSPEPVEEKEEVEVNTKINEKILELRKMGVDSYRQHYGELIKKIITVYGEELHKPIEDQLSFQPESLHINEHDEIYEVWTREILDSDAGSYRYHSLSLNENEWRIVCNRLNDEEEKILSLSRTVEYYSKRINEYEFAKRMLLKAGLDPENPKIF